MPSESGYYGQLTSLSGLRGAEGKGRVIHTAQIALTSAAVLILSANPKRISAIIQNQDDATNPGSNLSVYLGNPAYVIDAGDVVADLSPLGTLQIDANLPWTGEIYASRVTNSPTVVVTEISLL